LTIPQTLTDFYQLTKFRLSISVVISSIAGYFLAVNEVDYNILTLLIIGGFAMVGASNAFNQLFEKDLDKLMLRTQNRPLPQERMHSRTALFIGVFLTLIGVVSLYLINIKTAFFCRSIHFPLRLCIHSSETKNTLVCFCRGFSRSYSVYVGMGCSYQ